MSARQTHPGFKENKPVAPTLNSFVPPLTTDSIYSTNMDEVKGRVTLQTLQPSARVKGLVGSHGQIVHPGKEAVKSKSIKNSNHTGGLGKIQVFEDDSSQNGRLKPKSPQVEERGIQTDPAESQDFKTLTSEEISVDYYSTLAERRRLALAEALEENEQLHRQIEGLKGEIDSLREENSMLKPLAEEAEYLAGVLKDLVGPNTEEEAEVVEGAEANSSDS